MEMCSALLALYERKDGFYEWWRAADPLTKGQVCVSLTFSLMLACLDKLLNNSQVTYDLRRHDFHVTLLWWPRSLIVTNKKRIETVNIWNVNFTSTICMPPEPVFENMGQQITSKIWFETPWLSCDVTVITQVNCNKQKNALKLWFIVDVMITFFVISLISHKSYLV